MQKFDFQPISSRKLSDLVENSIRDLVLKGKIVPGERLPNEAEIGRQFGVSLVTVREALKGLETHGLIEKKKGKGGGIFVSESRSEAVKIPLYHFLNQKNFSAKDLSELRMIIEPVASKIATSRIADAKLVELEANIDLCEALIERVGPDFSEDDFFKLERDNIEFHRLIGEATDNPVLILTIDYVLDFLFNFKRMTLIPNVEFSKAVLRDHRLIYLQLQDRDGKAAEQAMISHLQNVEEYFGGKKMKKTSKNSGRRRRAPLS